MSCCSHAPCVEVPGSPRGLGRRAADAAADLQRPGGRGEDNLGLILELETNLREEGPYLCLDTDSWYLMTRLASPRAQTPSSLRPTWTASAARARLTATSPTCRTTVRSVISRHGSDVSHDQNKDCSVRRRHLLLKFWTLLISLIIRFRRRQ